MRRTLLFLLLAASSFGAFAQDKTVTFTFKAGDAMFYKNEVAGNSAKLEELFSLIDKYSEWISHGQIPILVDAYSTSGGSEQANKNLSFIRANRVKSELIEKKGLKEVHFTTRNLTTDYNGQGDVVVVTLLISKIDSRVDVAPDPAPQPQPQPEPQPEPQPTPAPIPEPEPEPLPVRVDPWSDKYCFALRTNLLYDAMLMPTLGVEWRVDRNWGVKLDGSLAWWSSETGNVQKMWIVNPELRKYMGEKKRFYLGLGGNYGEANVYGGMVGNILGSLFTKDTGYQGTFWNAGVTVGYQLPLAKRLSLDFNLGLGYSQFNYDTFEMVNDVRVSTGKDLTKNLFGPTQAGVSLVWRMGGK